MKDRIIIVVSKIETEDGKAPEWIVLFTKGKGKLETGEEYLVDEEAFRMVSAKFEARGIDMVIDYEHQTLKDGEAPAAGWIKELKWDAAKGIMGRVEWTEKGGSYVAAKEYRYHSPVFAYRPSDKRVVVLAHAALTNWPKTNNQRPLLAAKLGFDDGPDEETAMDLKVLIAKLGMKEDATEEEVLAKVVELAAGGGGTTEVVAKGVLDALGLEDDDDVSTVVASIHALNQQTTTMVAKADFDKLKEKLDKRDAVEMVAAAMTAGKVTAAQKGWAEDYAERDPKGFETFVAKAVQVVPVDKLPGKTEEAGAAGEFDDTTLAVAASMGNSKEDLEKYAEG